MSHCRPEQAEQVREIVDDVLAADKVVGATYLPPNQDPTDEWLIDVVLSDDAKGMTTDLARVVVRHGLTVRDVSPQGSHWQALLLV